jgi:arylsulfatase A-like enzyme
MSHRGLSGKLTICIPWAVILIVVCGLAAAAGGQAPAAVAPPRVNIVVIYADDLGYGDVQCYNPERGKIPTPHVDRLAGQGMRFTDAHSSSGVCSPSRYALLTGRYHWRTGKVGIVDVYGPPMIAANRLTVPSLLKQHGYRTAAIGKWHLGWSWPKAGGQIDFGRPIAAGPTTRGFDRYFGTDVPNWPPFCFIENDRTLGIPSEPLPAHLLRKDRHLASKPGPALPGWSLEAILPELAERAGAFLAEAAKRPEPFFLYLPLTSPHTPLAVNVPWRGRSGLGTYADFVMETDAVVGRVLDALDQSGAAAHTLVLFTSDNGCAPYIGVPRMEAQGHFPSGPLRGYKADAWEGGHRVPFIVRWPGVVPPGSRCDQLVHQADLLASMADLVGAELPPDAGEDSFSLLPLLKGADRPVREHAVSQSVGGVLALRRGDWKLLFGQGSGGWSQGSVATKGQLYDLARDLGERQNLYAEQPERVAALTQLMAKLISEGRSTPGARQKNEGKMPLYR